MEIFIGNIPKKMNAFELQRLVNRVLIPNGILENLANLVFRDKKIQRLEFDVVTEVKANNVVRYGKAIIEPDPAAKQLIRKLNNLPFSGSRLKVREFGHRSYNNERRAMLGGRAGLPSSFDVIERRNGERRVSTTDIQK